MREWEFYGVFFSICISEQKMKNDANKGSEDEVFWTLCHRLQFGKGLIVHIRGCFSETGARGTEEFGVTNQLGKTDYKMLGRIKTRSLPMKLELGSCEGVGPIVWNKLGTR